MSKVKHWVHSANTEINSPCMPDRQARPAEWPP